MMAKEKRNHIDEERAKGPDGKTNKTTNLPRDNTLEAMPKSVVLATGETWEGMNRNMLRQEGLFSIAENNKGLMCPFKTTLCQEGWCKDCQIYLDWQKLGELLRICSWCGKVIGKKDGCGQWGISHGMCPECYRRFQGYKE